MYEDSKGSLKVHFLTVVTVHSFVCRYSYFHKLLPLLMTGLSDELPDIQKQARQLMSKVICFHGFTDMFKASTVYTRHLCVQSHSISVATQVGDQYAAENEDELKDKMDFEEHPGYRLVTGNLTSLQCGLHASPFSPT